MADAAHQFHRIKRMEDARITRYDKTNSGVLYAAGQTLGCGIGPEFKVANDFFYTLGDFFIDRGDFVKNTRNGGDGYIRPSGDISYAYFFFNHVVIKRMGKG
jgi:hypothetical protein